MISLIEALNFRSLRYVSRPLDRFHVLVGPNASGKTTFLDVVAFLGRLVSDGVKSAVGERTDNFDDLLWNREGDHFELAIEAKLPESIREKSAGEEFPSIRYEVAVGRPTDSPGGEIGILREKVFLKPFHDASSKQRTLFPQSEITPTPIHHGVKRGWRSVATKKAGGSVNFIPEVKTGGKAWSSSFRFDDRKSILGGTPPDDSVFPASLWLRGLLV
ncbi:MAG: AAA family ATPase, partial [Planctomycetia bacterium]